MTGHRRQGSDMDFDLALVLMYLLGYAAMCLLARRRGMTVASALETPTPLLRWLVFFFVVTVLGCSLMHLVYQTKLLGVSITSWAFPLMLVILWIVFISNSRRQTSANTSSQ
jgi:hypothetical protein